MAGLAAAWSLSSPKCRGDIEVTVYQRGWRLGGKGASSRGRNGRIEEHGLHVWLGYYDNAFRLMRQVYGEIDRPVSDPSCVIPGFAQAFSPTSRVGIGEYSADGWAHWIATFSANRDEPGMGGSTGSARSSVAVFVRRAVSLLMDFAASLEPDAPVTSGVVLSGSPDPPAAAAPTARQLLRQVEIGVMVAALEAMRVAGSIGSGLGSPASFFLHRLEALQVEIARLVSGRDDSRRAADFADLLVTCIRGAIMDRLLTDPEGFASIDHLDLREWLRTHGASEQSCHSALVKSMYDLVFAYQDGDFARPRVSAGVGLFLAGKMFFEYRGSIFWHMQAGMGDIVFAPLYQALKQRGVRFEFFHRVDNLHLGADGRSVAAVTIGRQAAVHRDGAEYRPLVRLGNLPCFPDAPIADQLTRTVSNDLEKHWADRSGEQQLKLEAGVDFDALVLATSIGMIPHICPELLEQSPRWRDMVNGISTVPTQSLQLWLRPTEQGLGWPNAGSTVSGYMSPFDTYASMSHVIPREGWSADDRPGSLAYFCSALPDDGTSDPEIASKIVRGNAIELLAHRIGHFWPSAVDAGGGFKWGLLQAATERADDSALDSQFWQANIDPSDRYVQSLPGSLMYRLRADESGFRNLFLAGDWINNGHNGGCIEAAVISGVQAANAVRGRKLTKGILGDYRLTP